MDAYRNRLGNIQEEIWQHTGIDLTVYRNRRRAIIGKRTLVLWKSDFKRMLRKLPAMLAESALLIGILGILYGAVGFLYRDAPALQITIAVVEAEENPLTDFILRYVQGMESVSEVCQFLTVPEEEAFSMLQEGKAAAALFLPERMIEGIMDGSNVPVQVFFPEDAGVESALLRELTDAGVRMLRVAQAEIYGMYDTAKAYGAMERLSAMEMDIDRDNLAFAMERLALFRTQEVSATGKLSMMQYGIASGAVFFLLLLGMACYPVMQPYPKALQRQLVREGIGAGRQCFGKWLCGTCSMGISALFFRMLVGMGLRAAGFGAPMPDLRAGAGLLILLCASSFVFLVFQLAGNGTTAVLLLFFLSVVMQYLSGGFFPSVFLPETVQKIGKMLPSAYLIEAAGSLYTGSLSWKTVLYLVLYTVLCGSAACGFEWRRMKKEV